MTRLIVNYRRNEKTEFINIPCDEIKEENGFIYAYENEKLIAAVDLGCLDMAYLSEQQKA
ncbi:MAG TPA: hypothetical protein VN626_03595 [Clostridia bacterium]|nr:hypothetical protein [Clostridia bacterium]